ncbi:hypothetical protein LY56_01810 [Roseinatronobacter thiooxidans]|uniref:Type IV pilus biogenesis protein PilP n=1 Tax=Roseinatronobacter thiooxidans TaxID=121821 RepID=A0A2W7S2D4_9RHOB|nr:hypothetical protein [Roseinatronobacter thiooxidans]PZX44562.1 hypothetical protein LY56_01810 [Roseinatronobacter thiooxidans]
MKPNFALGLTEDGVTLWHRDATGWLRVGAVALDTPDMDAQMRDMSRMAAIIAPEGVRTKLVIPDEQILYCDLAVTSATPEAQEQELRAQLAGRTPYPVEELVFDWSLNGRRAQAVVVARETLVEAEDFAQLYGLNPITAVAAARHGATQTEPFFGTTRAARKTVPNISEIERDVEPVIEVGIARLPDPEPVIPASPPARARVDAQPDAAKAAGAAAGASSDTASKPPATTPPSGAKAATKAQANPAPSAAPAQKTDLAAKAGATKPAAQAQPVGKTVTPPPANAAPKDAPGTAANIASFRSRRSDSAAQPAPKKAASGARDLSSRLRAKARIAQAALSSAMQRGTRDAPVEGSAAVTSMAKAWVSPLVKTGKAATAKAVALKAAKPKTTTPAAPPPSPAQSARKSPIETLHARGGQEREHSSEAERMTIFGARNHQDTAPSGMNRALLVLGGVGLLLVAAAIWAAYFIATQPAGLQLADDPAQAIALDPEITAPAELATSLENATPLDDIEAALGVEDAAQQAPLDAPIADPVSEGPVAQAPDATAPGAQEIQSGRIAGLRSVALLAPQEATPLPAPPAAPAPFGSEPLAPLRGAAPQDAAPELDLDGDAAPVGQTAAALPAGEEALDITVSDGAPAVVPPVRPEGLAPELEAAAEADAIAQALAQATSEQEAQATPADPLDESALEISVTSGRPAATPPTRPEGIAPQPQPEEIAPEATETAPEAPEPASDDTGAGDEAALSAPSLGGISLTALRPAARPTALAADLPDADTTQSASFETATDLAVAASLRPGARPSQFSAIVQRTLRNAQPAAAPAPSQQPEPIQTARAAVPAAPAIPSSASVAREATQARAINLRQINLLGVMGTSSSRRALVRLSNGRVVTVRVGETLDGGQVTAIGDDELRYTRRGRNVVLRIAS